MSYKSFTNQKAQNFFRLFFVFRHKNRSSFTYDKFYDLKRHLCIFLAYKFYNLKRHLNIFLSDFKHKKILCWCQSSTTTVAQSLITKLSPSTPSHEMYHISMFAAFCLSGVDIVGKQPIPIEEFVANCFSKGTTEIASQNVVTLSYPADIVVDVKQFSHLGK